MRLTHVCCAALALYLTAPAAAQQPAGGKKADAAPATADAIRKALDQKITLDYLGQSLQETITHLRDKTKINFVLDTFVLQQMGLIVPDGVPVGPQQFVLKSNGGKARQALQDLLAPMGLSYVILRDSVVITTEEVGQLRQMRQRVNIDVKDGAVNNTLKQLAQETGVNLIIDPAVAKQAEKSVTLQLDDTSLETAVRLLTEMGGLKSVRIGNVLFVTTEERAAKLRREENDRPRHNQPGQPTFPFPGMGLPAFGGAANGAIGGFPPLAPPPPPRREVPPNGGGAAPGQPFPGQPPIPGQPGDPNTGVKQQ